MPRGIESRRFSARVGPLRIKRASIGRIGPKAQETVVSAAETLQAKIGGNFQKKTEIAVGASGPPAIQFSARGERRHTLQLRAEELILKARPHGAKDRQQPHFVMRPRPARDAARLDRERMRPASREQAEHMKESRARLQHAPRRRAAPGLESGLGARKPGPSGIGRAGEIGHEKNVEMGEVVRNILGCDDEIGRNASVGRGGQPLNAGQRQRGRLGLRDRTNAADARRDDQGVARIAALKDALEAAKQRGGHISRRHDPVRDFEAHFEIALDPVERTNDESGDALRFGALFLRASHFRLMSRTVGAIAT